MSIITDKIERDIKESQYSMMMVGASEDEPGFIYTIGLNKAFDMPEIIFFGLPPQVASVMMRQIIGDYIKSKRFEMNLGERDSRLIQGERPLDAVFLEVDTQINDYAIQWGEYYQRSAEEAKFVQMVWPDPQNVLPWEPGFDTRFNEAQPILNSEYKNKLNSTPGSSMVH